MFKPQRARDTSEEHIVKLLKHTPLIGMLKHDGVRTFVHNNVCTGKSMKGHNNAWVTKSLSRPEFNDLDGEILVIGRGATRNKELGVRYNIHNVLRETTSFMSSVFAKTDFMWSVFDMYHPTAPFVERFEQAKRIAMSAKVGEPLIAIEEDDGFEKTGWMSYTPIRTFRSLQSILDFERSVLSLDLEGIILRNPSLPYRQGTSSLDGELLRLKRYITAEMRITEVTAMQTNNNAATINPLGRSERSSHKANMVDKAIIGTFIGEVLDDVYDPFSGSLVLKKGTLFQCSATTIPRDESAKLFPYRHKLIGEIAKFKFFPRSILDKPRFPTFECFVSGADYCKQELVQP